MAIERVPEWLERWRLQERQRLLAMCWPRERLELVQA
jgi:hypothetical protein